MIIRRGGVEYVQCELCERFATMENAAKLGWDWFTGSLPRTMHYCKQHKNSEHHHGMIQVAGVKP